MKPIGAIEMGMINAISTEDHVEAIEEARPLFGHYEAAYIIARGYIRRFAAKPPLDVFKAQDEHWHETEGEFDYWFTEWLEARKFYATKKAMRDALESFEKTPTSPNAAINSLIGSLQQIGVLDGVVIPATDAAIEDRYEKFKIRAQYHGKEGFRLWGIPTGISAIDASRQGWMPGELIGFYARPTVGKTWLLLREGVIAWMSGKRVLLISPEMPVSQIAYRIDALIAGQLGIPFSHQGAIAGNPELDQAYSDLATKIKGNERWWSVSDIDGRDVRVSDIANLAARYKPDLILVDGVSLLGDDQRASQEWEKMKHVCYDLKRFATTAEVAVICSHQATNSRRGQRGNRDVAQGRGDDWVMPTLNDAAFGDAFVQAMSTVFTMAPDAEVESIRWYSIRKTRERKMEARPRMAFGWDVDRGLIIDLGRHGDDLGAIHGELRAAGIQT
jgi:hypothetical protein